MRAVGEPVDYPGRAAALGALIAAEAPAAEAAGRLTEPVVTALVEAGLLRLLLPAALGGAEVDPMTFMRTTRPWPRLTPARPGCSASYRGAQ